MKCSRCGLQAVVALPSHHAGFCRDCYLLFFARQIQKGLKKYRMLKPGDRVLVALSGGKDSMALVHQLHELGWEPHALHVDLDIPDSSAPARQMAEDFCNSLNVPLKIVEAAAHGLSIPRVKNRVRRPVCSVCGKIKRYLFNQFALDKGYTALATGHNLDDEAARLLANTVRWDISYLRDVGPVLEKRQGFARRIRPLHRVTEFETANYCFLSGIEYNTHPCPYSRGASFNVYKDLLHRLERSQPGKKIAFYENFQRHARSCFETCTEKSEADLAPCTRCGYPTSEEVCGVCSLKETLEEG
ncbi:MAG: TIGR00269 family protein [Desulfonatronovibrionaceae bacterium]